MIKVSNTIKRFKTGGTVANICGNGRKREIDLRLYGTIAQMDENELT